VAGGGGGQGQKGGEVEVGRDREASRRREGCSVREPAGRWEMGVGRKIGGNMGKTGGNVAVSLAKGPRALDWRSREVPTLPI
jgi:hypothetical protein